MGNESDAGTGIVLMTLLVIVGGLMFATYHFILMLCGVSFLCMFVTLVLFSIFQETVLIWIACVSFGIWVLCFFVIYSDDNRVRRHLPPWLCNICDWLNEIPPIWNIHEQ